MLSNYNVLKNIDDKVPIDSLFLTNIHLFYLFMSFSFLLTNSLDNQNQPLKEKLNINAFNSKRLNYIETMISKNENTFLKD